MILISYPMAGPVQRLKPAADGLVRLRLTISDVDWAGRPYSAQPRIVDTPADRGLTDREAQLIELAPAVRGQLIGASDILGVSPNFDGRTGV